MVEHRLATGLPVIQLVTIIYQMHPIFQEWELDWGALVPDRTANQARRRWTLMLKHVESVNDREFTERLLVLVRSACTPPAALMDCMTGDQCVKLPE
jgi:hypothetical protein